MNRADDAANGAGDDLRDLAAAYALDALDESDRARFERALADSPELQAEVESFRAIATGLGDGVEPVAPPASLKASLFDKLDAAPQERRADAAASVTPQSEPAAAPEVAPASDTAPEFVAAPAVDLAARRARRRIAIAWSSAAAVVLLVAGAFIGANWFGPNGWGAQREMASLAAASDAQQTTAEVTGGGEVTLVSSAEQGRSAIVADGLSELGDEHTYELWYIDESGAVSAGTFDVTGSDEAWRILEGEFAQGLAVGITVEPAGGSPQPTTEPVAVIQT
ncbi:Anti-sigma-K factor RskA [Agromyces sp. CF514]|uniref:anti-sigma factor n=1 Tax=Agromyces sp. CF514 TaxID=1881031 RepID=UPI0008EFE8F2|nr:anti-sigma factor [Agromyces sp. CF514]SFR82711.1 Anti-sigma-K factor RskA [Agromyces sp. CF514]